ncbi:eukaryotic translation initiation factor 5 [Paramarasmius palmivorus]|uniref:Eukaryotic translation initiation factor 5 n=1 Tax=Paramarasmius palmivorus TaxID=297713 RepID=A0AAW0DH94_9AGAR
MPLLTTSTAEAKNLNADTALAKEDWSADTSPEAVKQQTKVLEGGLAGISMINESSDGQLGRWVEENHDDDDTRAFALFVYKKVEELGIEKKHKTVLVLMQALFTENVVAEVPEFAPLFAEMVNSEKHQKSLLDGIERLVGLS